jgi:uroporphyrinogen III methyltransferase / synthase
MRIGTRGSALALAQAGLVAELLGDSEIIPFVTSGDRGAASNDKSRWVLELEDALRRGEIDLAVHSAKDVPGELAEGLSLLGSPARASAQDVLCGADSLDGLDAGARVATSSLRRISQLRSAREDLEVVAIRGNVDTRLRKLAEGDIDAIVLARAGLQRLGRESEAGSVLDPQSFVPAPGQGTLALEGRTEDEAVRGDVAEITDSETFACLLAERALARTLGASCNTPLGAWAIPACENRLRMRAWVGLPGAATSCSARLATPRRSDAASRPGSSSRVPARCCGVRRRWRELEPPEQPGRVFLVGAGPGGPGLLTARALELIASADVILYDRLIGAGALDGARADAELVFVGKEGGGASVPQELTETLMVERAQQGATVVRLKGGDPFVFGRGGEEALALRAAGISYEVVPGVTAGLAAAAYAGIPVTHRGLSSAVALVTGHAAGPG